MKDLSKALIETARTILEGPLVEDNLDLVMKAGKANKPIEIKLRDGKYKLDDYQAKEIYKAMSSKRGKDVINIVRNMFDKTSKVQSAEIAYNDIARSF